MEKKCFNACFSLEIGIQTCTGLLCFFLNTGTYMYKVCTCTHILLPMASNYNENTLI